MYIVNFAAYFINTCVLIAWTVIFYIPTNSLSTHGSNDELLDTSYPILLQEANIPNSANTFFGYSVSIAKGIDQISHPPGWVFIGAPKSNTSNNIQYNVSGFDNEPGVIWRCSLGESSKEGDVCEMMNIDPPEGRTSMPGNPKYESHNGSWIGVVSELNYGRFVSCGMRWNRGQNQFYNGICYWFSDNPANSNRASYRSNINGKTLVDTELLDQRLIPFFVQGSKTERLFNYTNYSNVTENAHEWQASQAGISVHLFEDSSSGSSDPNLLIGAPGVREWAGAVVLYINRNETADSFKLKRLNRNKLDPTFSEFVVLNRGIKPEKGEIFKDFHWNEYFGYSVSSGRYLSKNETLFAAGTPKADYCGAVIIFTYPKPVTTNKAQIQPVFNVTDPSESFASYFGSVIHSVDLDGNGLDELIVGAPLYTFRSTNTHDFGTVNEVVVENVADSSRGGEERAQATGDHGCVFVYKFKNTETDLDTKTTPLQVLVGSRIPGARFGSAISTFKLNLKSSSDATKVYLVVGAPYEQSEYESKSTGAIYVYLYNQEMGKFATYSQRITASRIDVHMKGFGSSLSIPEDIDDNGTPDLAVGAYQSGHAVIFRTRPRILLKCWMEFSTSKDGTQFRPISKITIDTTEFYLKSCFNVRVAFKYKFSVKRPLKIWTRVKFFDKTIKFLPNAVERSTDNEIIYSSDVVDGDISFCSRNIKIRSVDQDGIGMDDPDTKLTTIVFSQTVWYNETLDRPDSVLKMNVGHRIRQKLDFTSFSPKLPYPQTSTSEASLPVSDCRDEICQPELSMDWSFFHPQSKSMSMTSYVLGSSQEIIMRLVITNTGETAETPKIAFAWKMKDITESTAGNRWLHKNCINLSDPTSRIFHSCNLGRHIRRNRNKTIEIIFNVEDVFAHQPMPFKFIVDAEFKDIDDHKKESGELQFQVPLTRATIIGSFKNETLRGPISYITKSKGETSSTVLYASFRQTYVIEIEGSSVNEAAATFRIPISWMDSVDNSKQMFLVKKPDVKSANVRCYSTSPNFDFHIIESISSETATPISTSPTPLEPEQPPLIGEVTPRRRRRREVVTKSSELSEENLTHNTTTAAQKIENNAGQPSQDTFLPDRPPKPRHSHPEDALKITCNSENDCLDVKCTFSKVKPKNSIHIPFEIFPVKESIDNVLKSTGKSALFMQSNGSVDIFPISLDRRHYHDADMAGTVLTKISAKVDWWVYVVATGGGIFVLVCIIIALYKCGFFKREKREELNTMKAEHYRRSMIARASMMIQSTSAAADGSESKEKLTDAEHKNDDLDVIQEEPDEQTESSDQLESQTHPLKEVKDGK